jgi:hypothetical protein
MMATPQQLVDLSTQLTGAVKSINDLVGKQPLPYDEDTARLADTAAQLAAKANSIGQVALTALANDVQTAIGELTSQVTDANTALARISELKRALSLAGTVLTCAGTIAACAGSANWVGAAAGVIALTETLQAAIAALPPAAAPHTAVSAPSLGAVPAPRTTARKRKQLH